MFYVAYDHSDGTPRGIFYDSTIAALQTSNGALRWEKHFDHLLTNTTLTASPDGRPALAHDGTVAELDAGNGSNHWQQSVNVQEDEVFLSLIQAGGKLVEAYQSFHSTTPASIGAAHLCALEPATGQTLWCHDFNTQAWVVELGP
jgi:outer membrane protein assembly factor BamB